MAKIFLSIPSYTGSVEVKCFVSLLQNIRHIESFGHTVQIDSQIGNCYIPLARNASYRNFMSTDCTDFVFVDSDLSFDSDALYKLMRHDVDIVAGAYPFKTGIDGFPVDICVNEDRTPVCKNGLVEAIYVPTGFMRIRRRVFEKMELAFGELRLADGMIPLFDTGDIWNDGKWHGEDVTFCRRWRDIGGNIWIDPDITFGHIGKSERVKNYHEYLCSLPRP
jgi:hypothetical protein